MSLKGFLHITEVNEAIEVKGNGLLRGYSSPQLEAMQQNYITILILIKNSFAFLNLDK